MRTAALAATLLLILSPILTTGQQPSAPRTVPVDAWLAVPSARASVEGLEPSQGWIVEPDRRAVQSSAEVPSRQVVPVPSPRLIVVTVDPVRSAPPRTGRSVQGKASFYCSPSRPICHYRYPVGSMVAAACGKLRRAIGVDWRGRRVTVTYRARSVSVVLVDFCASADKTIDLYAAPFDRLGDLSQGVLPVTVRWQ